MSFNIVKSLNRFKCMCMVFNLDYEQNEIVLFIIVKKNCLKMYQSFSFNANYERYEFSSKIIAKYMTLDSMFNS